MRFGPLTVLDLNKLTALLDVPGLEYEIFHSREDLELANAARASALKSPYPTFDGPDRFIYIEIQKEALFVIKQELEKMGYLSIESDEEALLDDEYYCSQCDYKSNQKGFCPKHQGQLLEFSNWLRQKKEPSNWGKYFSLLATLLVLSFFIYEALHNAPHLPSSIP
jgi:hypothetical protein